MRGTYHRYRDDDPRLLAISVWGKMIWDIFTNPSFSTLSGD